MFRKMFGGPPADAVTNAKTVNNVNTLSARTSSASTLAVAATIAAVGNASASIPIIGAGIAGIILLIGAAVKTSANLRLQADLIKQVERQLISTYYQFKVIERSLELSEESKPKENRLTLDLTGLKAAIQSLQIALVKTVGTQEQQNALTTSSAAAKDSAGIRERISSVLGKAKANAAWAARGANALAGRDLTSEMNLVKGEADVLEKEMNNVFRVFSTHRPLLAPLEILKNSSDPEDTKLVENYKNATDNKQESVDKSIDDFKDYFRKQPKDVQEAATKVEQGEIVAVGDPAPPDALTPAAAEPNPGPPQGGGLWPPKYYRGLSTRKKGQRRREITRRAKMSWKNPAAYRPFATDRGTKRRPSSYTSRFHAKYPGVTGLPAISKATHVPMSVLNKVYDRGLAAWRTGHRPGASQHAWGMARVHSFVLHGKTWRTADADLARRNSSH